MRKRVTTKSLREALDLVNARRDVKEGNWRYLGLDVSRIPDSPVYAYVITKHSGRVQLTENLTAREAMLYICGMVTITDQLC